MRLTSYFRRRALAAGVASGALGLAGLLVMRHAGLDLTRGTALAMVAVSGVAGLVTLVLCWLSRFQLARLSAAIAVAAVVAGWAAAQSPRMLPGMTVTQAAAGRSTLIAVIIAVGCGAAVLIPSLALLYTLFLRGRLDAPDTSHPAAPSATGSPTPAPVPAAGQPSPRPRLQGAIAVVGLVAGSGLLVFASMAWGRALGVACFIACAVATFQLANQPGD